MTSIAQRGWRAWSQGGWAGGADPTVVTPLPHVYVDPEHPMFARAEDQAQRVEARWDALRLPDELCGVQIVWPLLYTSEQKLEAFRRRGLDPESGLDCLRRFHRRLTRKARFVYCSDDQPLNFAAQLPVSVVLEVMQDPACRRWMPATLDRATTLAGDGGPEVQAFNEHIFDLIIRSAETAIRASGLLDKGARFVQQGAAMGSRPIYDECGGSRPRTATPCRTSCAAACAAFGWRYSIGRIPEGWASLVDSIEIARACTDAGTGQSFVPSLSTDPASMHPWVFNELLGHLCRTPQPSQPFRDFVLRNAAPTAAREAQVQQQLLKHMQARTAALLPPVGMDVGLVTTGTFTTTLADYQLHVR